MGTHSETLQFGILGALTKKVVRYMVPGNGAEQATEITIRVTRPGTLKNLYLQQRAAGTKATYTVRKNAQNTAITALMDRAATQVADLVNTAAVVAGDRISISVSATTTVGSTDIVGSVELDHGEHRPHGLWSAQR